MKKSKCIRIYKACLSAKAIIPNLGFPKSTCIYSKRGLKMYIKKNIYSYPYLSIFSIPVAWSFSRFASPLSYPLHEISRAPRRRQPPRAKFFLALLHVSTALVLPTQMLKVGQKRFIHIYFAFIHLYTCIFTC